jgi:NAD(P)-dependent dehydrogenase (short-subunit alcohol dehydrogenase family)
MDLPSQNETVADAAHRRLAGRAALVTGAGRGIGRAIALELSRAGAHVALVARSHDELARTAELVRDDGGIALVVRADLADPDQLAYVPGRVAAQLGPVTVLVNNAAVVAPLGPSAAIEPTEFAAALTLNVAAVAGLTFALLPGMLAARWGRVVDVSSGIVAHPESMIGGNAYVTTKTALEAHAINLAAELTGSAVTVNSFRPDAVDTAMQAWIRDQDPREIGAALHDRFTRSLAEGRLITPEESARSLLARLPGEATGRIWDVSDPL